jgi:peptidoglycan/LPS O-acetylase OafA/YrhL
VFASLLFGQLFKKSFWLYSIYIQNLLDMDSLNDYFPVAWSLSIEEWFYLTFPVTLLAVSFFTAKRRATVALVVGISYALTITVFRTVYGDYSHWGLDVRRVVAYRLDSVAYGFLLFLAHRERLSLQVSRFPATAYFLALLVASFGIFLVTRDAAAGGVFSKHAFPFVAAVFGMLAIHWFSLLNESIQRIPLMTPLSLFLGRISYSIYLFHLVVLLALKAIPTSLDILSQFALYLAILIAFAAGFYQWVEKPILAARPDFRARVDLGRDELGRTRPPILNMSASS